MSQIFCDVWNLHTFVYSHFQNSGSGWFLLHLSKTYSYPLWENLVDLLTRFSDNYVIGCTRKRKECILKLKDTSIDS